MSISKKLDETLSSLDLDSSAQELKERVISKSMNNLKEKLSGLDIQVERKEKEVVQEAPKPHYEGTELAEIARGVYRTNIKSRDRSDKIDDVEKKVPEDQPSTIASRANVRALSRSLAGMRTSGNEGKTSPTGPNGVGNVGKLSPTGDDGVGNVSNNFGTYYALTTDMTLEEYEQYVNNIFEGDDCGCQHDKEDKTKKEIKARGGPPGYPDKSIKKEEVEKKEKKKESKYRDPISYALETDKKLMKIHQKEDVVAELEQKLVTLGSTDWIVVDQVLRETARDHGVEPIEISKEFRSRHGMYPDKWIKEHLDLEVCGFMPLEEAVRLNKVGKIYEVTFMFRGGTNRLKFFWPHPGDASKEDMQREVEKFWPKGRVLAFYPSIDNEQNSNCMVMAPPMTENYHFMQPEDWNEVSEEAAEVFEIICEEEGEPISPLMNQENGYSVVIEDHDTGEQRQVNFSEEGLRDWFGKSSSKDGKSGWVNVVTGGTCASDEPGEGTPKCVSSSKRNSMSEAERKSASRRKKAADPNQQSKSGAAKPTNVKTDVKEETDKKGKGSGTKDACYHKVKSRYSVWPSAYASGALVKCRKKGAANWGNSSKKEEVEYVEEKFKYPNKKMQDKVEKQLDNVHKNPKQDIERRNERVRSMDIALDDMKYEPKRFMDDARAKKASNVAKGKGTVSEEQVDEGAAWTKKSGKNSEGGLNEKGRKSYERENPGSDLKAPSKEKGNPRRKSFCARMKGMRKRQKPSNNTGDDRLSKSLRAWNC
jgi:hypothetical protein